MVSSCTSVDCTGRISTEQLPVNGPSCHLTPGHIAARHTRTSFWPTCLPSCARICLGLGYHLCYSTVPSQFWGYIHQSQHSFIKTQYYDSYVLPDPYRDIPSSNKYETIQQCSFLSPPEGPLLGRQELDNLLMSTHNYQALRHEFSRKKTK